MSRVDVLAALEQADRQWGVEYDLLEIRDAVAELIAAAVDPLLLDKYPYRGDAAKAKTAAVKRFRAALARVTGEQA